MTEQEWQEGTQAWKMLTFLAQKGSKRKMRLFGAACCRRVWLLLEDNRCRAAVELAERLADGLASEMERKQVRGESLRAEKEHPFPSQDRADLKSALYRSTTTVANFHATDAARNASFWSFVHFQWWDRKQENVEREAQCQLMRDLFGNPFRPVAFDPAWRTPSVTAVAQAIYAERRFADLPILADALEEVGCNNADILAHCCNGKEHVLGCWALDLVLGKE